MNIKSEKGAAGIDISISIIIITIFITIIANLIVNVNVNKKNIERATIATSYAVKEIENIKTYGMNNYVYKENNIEKTISYIDKGLSSKEKIRESDILDTNNKFTGYHKEIFVEDYTYIKNDNTKQKNILKKVTVVISYKVGNKDKNVSISTYIFKT